MTVGERIKELRTNLGLSQVDFADKINVSKQTLYKYENNIITNIPSDKIEAAARLGNVSPAYLMGWDSWDSAIKLISNEIKRASDQTRLYIQLFESYGYKINLKLNTVDVQTKDENDANIVIKFSDISDNSCKSENCKFAIVIDG